MKSPQWRNLTLVGLAILAVLVTAHFEPDTAEPIEVFWACLGAGGGVYGFLVWYRRWDFERWRKRTGGNGLLGLTIHGHVVLRLAGLLGQVLILISGLSSMATPPSIRAELQMNDLITTLCLIGLAVQSAFSCWYAERTVEQQTKYIQMHAEP